MDCESRTYSAASHPALAIPEKVPFMQLVAVIRGLEYGHLWIADEDERDRAITEIHKVSYPGRKRPMCLQFEDPANRPPQPDKSHPAWALQQSINNATNRARNLRLVDFLEHESNSQQTYSTRFYADNIYSALEPHMNQAEALKSGGHYVTWDHVRTAVKDIDFSDARAVLMEGLETIVTDPQGNDPRNGIPSTCTIPFCMTYTTDFDLLTLAAMRLSAMSLHEMSAQLLLIMISSNITEHLASLKVC